MFGMDLDRDTDIICLEFRIVGAYVEMGVEPSSLCPCYTRRYFNLSPASARLRSLRNSLPNT